jgi:hypothetical protein
LGYDPAVSYARRTQADNICYHRPIDQTCDNK